MFLVSQSLKNNNTPNYPDSFCELFEFQNVMSILSEWQPWIKVSQAFPNLLITECFFINLKFFIISKTKAISQKKVS